MRQPLVENEMTYGFYVNGRERLPEKAEKEELTARLLQCLGYEKREAAEGAAPEPETK